MKRSLFLGFVLLSFCCSPKPNDPPKPAQEQTKLQQDWGEPRAENRYATPPVGADPAPTTEWKAKNEAPTTAPPLAMEEPPSPPPSSHAQPKKSADAPPIGGRNGYGGGDADSAAEEKEASRGAMMRQDKTVRPAPQPDDRPGLGTSWGENRYSHVEEVPFVRASGSPTFTATLWYNDRQGANAMAQTDSQGYVGYHRAASLALGRAVTMTLRNEYGSPLEAIYANGRTSAIGEAGQRYTISLQNQTGDRFEVVLSVDGLDVLDGRPAGYQKRGYLLEPYASIEIDGFRQSDDYVAAFRFGSVRDSYASRTGNGRNVGVIGCAVFAERGYYSYREIERRRQADPFPSKYANPPMYMVH